MLHVQGPLLSIDVSDRTAETEAIDEVASSFVGGRGVATKLAHDRIPFDADPFGPENRLYFSTGPLQTSIMSFTGRMNATALSPLTDGLVSSNAGGFMSRPFADTGYAAVEITGESDDLVAVHVTDEGVEFEEVEDLRGATVSEVGEYMDEEHDLGDENLAVAGPAGENLVRFAAIITTEHRAFARGGLGAVLGSKNVKCVSFRGDSRREVDVPDVSMDVHREASTADHVMKETGTVSVLDYANHVEALPTRYFSELSFEGSAGINADAISEKKYKKGTCSACAFACKLPTRDEESGLTTEGPEFETTMAFGSNAGVDDIRSVMKSNDQCDELGLDTISCGDVVSAYLQAEDEFGNEELIEELVEKIAHREGVGDTLAEGIDRIHDELGVENWSVKGMEFAAHDGRALNGQGLSFAVANRGADHMYGEFYSLEYPLVGDDKALDREGLEGKPPKLAEKENLNALKDSAVICKFSRDFVPEDRLERLLDEDYERLQEIGARVVELERHFNNQRGMDREDDRLPYDLPDFEAALDEYYEVRGWNQDGTVPGSRIEGGGPAPADD
ncbi:aldehyde ferredoxin oxidoreductase [Halobacteriales archaeon QS_8_69_26]|nr:MAG: aldehyde ferredoxin oxidoreductase [Halobacteriales archaeon QS_8_69_26]